MIIKYKENLPKHYFNHTPAPATIKQAETKYLNGKHIVYQLAGTYEEKCKNRLLLGIKTFAITFFSLGFALFSQKLRENWQSVWTGTRKIVVYLETKEPTPSTIEKVKVISSPLNDVPQTEEEKAPSPSFNDTPPVVVEPPKPSLEDLKKQQLDNLVKALEGKSEDEWIQSLKELEKDPKVPLRDLFLRLYTNEKVQELINKTELGDLTKCKKITFINEEEKKEIDCLQLDCELLRLNFEFFDSIWNSERRFLEADTNNTTSLNDVDVKTFQNLLKIIRDVSFLNKLDINENIALCDLLDRFQLKASIKLPVRKAIRSFLKKDIKQTDDLDLNSFKHIYRLVNRNHESSTLRGKFVNRLIDDLKDQSLDERIRILKDLKNDFGPSLIAHIYDSWKNSPPDLYNFEEHFDLAFISQLFMASLQMKQNLIQHRCIVSIAILLNHKTENEYIQSIDTLEPAILVGLFESNCRLKIEYLTQAKLSLIREHYRIKYKESKNEEQLKKDIIEHLIRCFPSYKPQEMASQFKELSDLTEKIQQAFSEISFATISSEKYHTYPFLPAILYMQKALEVLNSELDGKPKRKSYGELIKSIKGLWEGSLSTAVFFIASLANLVKTVTLPILLKSNYNIDTIAELLTQILESNDKDKIQILFRDYLAKSAKYGTAFAPSRRIYIKSFETKEWGTIHLRSEFLEILPFINSSEKLEWILETLPQNELKEIFTEILRKGVTIRKDHFLPKIYRVGLSSKEVEETFTRLGY